MSRSLNFIGASALALIFCLPGHGQDAPSLGDLARQAQKDKDKDKTNKPVAKTLTNDDISSGSSGGSSALPAGLAQVGQPASSPKSPAQASAAQTSPADELEKLDSILNQVDALDRATLARNILQGSDADFPGRANWEERLFAAKQTYVTQGRALLEKARQMEASAESLKGIQDPNDPRVKSMNAKLQELVRDGVQVGAAFQAVMMEGRDLAGLPAPH